MILGLGNYIISILTHESSHEFGIHIKTIRNSVLFQEATDNKPTIIQHYHEISLSHPN